MNIYWDILEQKKYPQADPKTLRVIISTTTTRISSSCRSSLSADTSYSSSLGFTRSARIALLVPAHWISLSSL